MPRIQADTLASHVSQQRALIFTEAARLFALHGVAGVSLGDIAESVGLKRNSLYRYFADKDDLIVALVEQEMGQRSPLPEFSRPAPPMARLHRWVDHQLDLALDPSHAIGNEIARSPALLSAQARARIAALHADALATITDTVIEALGPATPSQAPLIVEMLTALVSATAGTLIRGVGTNDGLAARAILHRMVDALLNSANAGPELS